MGRAIVSQLSIAAAGGSKPAHGVSFAEALRVWLRVAALSFGGPAGQIAVMHRIIVDEKRWVVSPVSCMRSVTACCCPDPKPSSSRPILAG